MMDGVLRLFFLYKTFPLPWLTPVRILSELYPSANDACEEPSPYAPIGTNPFLLPFLEPAA